LIGALILAACCLRGFYKTTELAGRRVGTLHAEAPLFGDLILKLTAQSRSARQFLEQGGLFDPHGLNKLCAIRSAIDYC